MIRISSSLMSLLLRRLRSLKFRRVDRSSCGAVTWIQSLFIDQPSPLPRQSNSSTSSPARGRDQLQNPRDRHQWNWSKGGLVLL